MSLHRNDFLVSAHQEELHRQYVLTYYTELQPGEGGPPEVKVRRPGLEVRSAVPLETVQ